MDYKEYFTTKLVRTTFLGFILGLVVIYLKPELQNSVMVMYGILGGRNAVEHYTQNKSKDLPKKE